MRERIALFLPSLIAGGAQRVMVNLARGLADRGLDVDLVLSTAEGPYLSEVSRSVRLVDLKARRVLASLPKLVRYLRAERPRALLSTLTYANVVALWAARLARVSTRVVVREANTLSLASQGATDGRDRILPALARHCYPWADGIVAVSEGAAGDLARTTALPRERISVLDNPSITPELRALAAAPLDEPWFRPGAPPVILGVGRLSKQKDFPSLLRAFADVRRAREARLLILGEGEDRSGLAALIAELGLSADAALPGFVQNPFAYMARAAVFVLSSAWEGSPGALIQALACGAPVVATDCESGPREILQGGRFGQLVPCGDVPALSAAILTAIDGPRAVVPREAWYRFSQDAAVDGYLRVLEHSAP
jgi:glycosyltransferase involved in cell wall biosynthesis